MKVRLIWLIAACIMTGVIWRNSLMPGPVSSGQSERVTEVVEEVLESINYETERESLHAFIRQSAHFGQFFVLGLLLMGAFWVGPNSYAGVKALGVGGTIATIDETIQLFVPGRAFQWTDIAIDTFGVLMAVCLVSLVVILWRKFRPSVSKS